ncbi:MAG: hypothetical protein M1834_003617 [Cirrosporium novae-zelandiae]|nr:MAG: hypothetical protein M1834_003617 [Cirrosporium novae-zelandiae]
MGVASNKGSNGSRITVFRILLSIPKAPFRGPHGAPTIRRHISYGALRAFAGALDSREYQAVLPSTRTSFSLFSRLKGLPQQIIRLSDGTEALWLGSPEEHKVILYCHGGGYCAPITPEDMGFMLETQRQTGNVSVLVMAYGWSFTCHLCIIVAEIDAVVRIDLAPGHPYPRQLQQVTTVMRYLLEDLNKIPSDISLFGQSAGGHLILSLLSHISHPHPTIPSLRVNGKFKNAVLMSPWPNANILTSSKKYNEQKDILPISGLQMWHKHFLGNAEVDPYNSPISAPPSWWNDLNVGDIMITAGGNEIIRSDIETLATALKVFTLGCITIQANPKPQMNHLGKNSEFHPKNNILFDNIVVIWLYADFIVANMIC